MTTDRRRADVADMVSSDAGPGRDDLQVRDADMSSTKTQGAL